MNESEKDKRRLDWLEKMVRDEGGLHLHDGEHPYGLGLGLKKRTLREAIDQAMDDCVCPEAFGEENLSGSKVTDSELRQACDTSEGSSEMAATCCGLENRHEESAPAQTLSPATADLRLDQTESLSQWYDDRECPNCGRKLADCNGNCIFK